MKRFMRWAAVAYFTIGVLYAALLVEATNASLLWCALLVIGWLPWQVAPDATGTALMPWGSANTCHSPLTAACPLSERLIGNPLNEEAHTA